MSRSHCSFCGARTRVPLDCCPACREFQYPPARRLIGPGASILGIAMTAMWLAVLVGPESWTAGPKDILGAPPASLASAYAECGRSLALSNSGRYSAVDLPALSAASGLSGGNGSYLVRASLRALDSAGAEARPPFECRFRADGTGEWTLEAARLRGDR